MKKLALVENCEGILSECISSFFSLRKDVCVNVYKKVDSEILNNSDVVVFLNEPPAFLSESFRAKIIVTHPSLLPAFDTSDSIKEAFLAGVKVSGVTVKYATGRIIAQFPVLIDSDTDFDSFKANITKTEKMFYPLVIKSILDDKAFSFAEVMGGSSQGGGCSGNCGSCGGCN